jgi:hypothetical protein
MSGYAGEQPQSELSRRRDQLAEEVAELHWNLGGLTYEMAIRDHFRIDVLVRRAAMLQEREAELAEVERLLHMQEGSIAGACASCGAVRSRGAVFCWQCGAQVMEQRAPDTVGAGGAGVRLGSAELAEAHATVTPPTVLAGGDAGVLSRANSPLAPAVAAEGEARRETARPVVAPAVSRETDVASRAIAQGDELGIGRPVPIP